MTTPMLQKGAFFTFLVGAAIVSAGCSSTTSPTVPAIQALDQSEQAELDSARSRWVALGMQDYEFDIRKGCLCAPDQQQWRHIEVRGGHIVAVIVDGTTATTLQRITEPGWWTIDELFQVVHDKGTKPAEFDLTVAYDAAMGYPTIVQERSFTPDGGVSWFVRGVKPLN